MFKKMTALVATLIMVAPLWAKSEFKAEDFHNAMQKAIAFRKAKRLKGNCLRESTNTLRLLAGKRARRRCVRTFFSAPCTYSIAYAKRPQRFLPKPKTKTFRLYSDFVWCRAEKSPTGMAGWFLVTHGKFAQYKGGFVQGQIGDQVYIAEGINEGGRGFCLRHSLIFVGGEEGKQARYVCCLSSDSKGEPLRKYWGDSYRGQIIHQVRRYNHLFYKCSANANQCPNSLVPPKSSSSTSKSDSGENNSALSLLGSLASLASTGKTPATSGSGEGLQKSPFTLASANSKTGSSSSTNKDPFSEGPDSWLDEGIPEDGKGDGSGSGTGSSNDGMQPGVMSEDDPFYEGVDDVIVPPLPKDPDTSDLMPMPQSWNEPTDEGAFASYEGSEGSWDFEPEFD